VQLPRPPRPLALRRLDAVPRLWPSHVTSGAPA
jgi:hypothetical protein